jgi:hypothetical protein
MGVPLVPNLSQINPLHTLVSYFFKIYFNSIHTNEIIELIYISYILTFIFNSAPLKCDAPVARRPLDTPVLRL